MNNKHALTVGKRIGIILGTQIAIVAISLGVALLLCRLVGGGAAGTQGGSLSVGIEMAFVFFAGVTSLIALWQAGVALFREPERMTFLKTVVVLIVSIYLGGLFYTTNEQYRKRQDQVFDSLQVKGKDRKYHFLLD